MSGNKPVPKKSLHIPENVKGFRGEILAPLKLMVKLLRTMLVYDYQATGALWANCCTCAKPHWLL